MPRSDGLGGQPPTIAKIAKAISVKRVTSLYGLSQARCLASAATRSSIRRLHARNENDLSAWPFPLRGAVGLGRLAQTVRCLPGTSWYVIFGLSSKSADGVSVWPRNVYERSRYHSVTDIWWKSFGKDLTVGGFRRPHDANNL